MKQQPDAQDEEEDDYETRVARYFPELRKPKHETGSLYQWLSQVKENQKSLKRTEAKSKVQKTNTGTINSTSPENIGHPRFPRYNRFDNSKAIIESMLENTGQGKRKSKYDPALKLMGLGKREKNNGSVSKFIGRGKMQPKPSLSELANSVKRDSIYDPAMKYMGLGKRYPETQPNFKDSGLRNMLHDVGLKLSTSDKGGHSGFTIKNLDKRVARFASASKPTYLSRQNSGSDWNGLGAGKWYRKFNYGKRLKNHGAFETLYDPALKYMGLGKRVNQNTAFKNVETSRSPLIQSLASLTRAKRSLEDNGSNDIYRNGTEIKISGVDTQRDGQNVMENTYTSSNFTGLGDANPSNLYTNSKYDLLNDQVLQIVHRDGNSLNLIRKFYSICATDPVNGVVVPGNRTETKRYSPMDLLTKYAREEHQQPMFASFLDQKLRGIAEFPNFDSGMKLLQMAKSFPISLCSKTISPGSTYGSSDKPVYGTVVLNETPSPKLHDQVFLTLSTSVNAIISRENNVLSKNPSVQVKTVVIDESDKPFHVLITTHDFSTNGRGNSVT